MRITFLVSLTVCLIFAACKKRCSITTTLIRDCTGTYLRFKGMDNPVCNPKTLSRFSDGETINVMFKTYSGCRCAAKEDITCQMVHPFEIGEWVVITKVEN